MYDFRLKFHSNLSIGVNLTIFQHIPTDQVPHFPNRPTSWFPTLKTFLFYMPCSMNNLLYRPLSTLWGPLGRSQTAFTNTSDIIAWPMVTDDSVHLHRNPGNLIHCLCYHGADGLLETTAVFCLVVSWRHNNVTLGTGTVWRMTSFAVVQPPVADRVSSYCRLL